jgi:hypothetical protein
LPCSTSSVLLRRKFISGFYAINLGKIQRFIVYIFYDDARD